MVHFFAGTTFVSSHSVHVGTVAAISDVHVASIFRLKMSGVPVHAHTVSFCQRDLRKGVGTSALSEPVTTMDGGNRHAALHKAANFAKMRRHLGTPFAGGPFGVSLALKNDI
jgi:hypothetical protein